MKEVIESLAGNPSLAELAGMSLGLAFDLVIGEDTFEDLEACEKTFIGTRFEKNLVRALGLPKSKDCLLDTRIANRDVDIKCTVGKNWMIPPECVGQVCLLCRADPKDYTFSLGVFEAHPDHLTRGGNRDKKRTINAKGKKTIIPLCEDAPILKPSKSLSSH